jgi:hypothetical protein
VGTPATPNVDKYGRPIEQPNYAPAAQAAVTSWQVKDVTPPSPVYVTVDDGLVFRTFSSVAGATVVLTVRFLVVPDGQIHLLQFQQVTDGLRDKQEQISVLGEGFILSAQVQVSGLPDAKRGQLFVNVHINRPATLVGQSAFSLISDYKVAGTDLGFPGSMIRHPTEGPGWSRIMQIGNPAAGADWIATVPAGARWRVQAISETFTASAAVASRQAGLFLDDGANVYWANTAPTAITASQIVTISATGSSAPQGAAPFQQTIVIPPGLFIPAGHRFKSTTVNIQAGDQYSAINILVEEWIEP